MAGFMAGFGEGFSQSFNAGLERNARRKEDEFKLMYKDYLSRRGEAEKAKKESTARVRQAQSLTEMAGVDKRAWPKVYEMLESGLDEKTILENVQTGSFSFKETNTTQPVDNEMQQVGMAPTPQQPEAPKGPGNEFFGKLLGGNRLQRRTDRSVNRIAEVTGQSPDAIKSTLAGATSTPGIDSSGITFTPGQPKEKFYTGLKQGFQAVVDAQAEYERNPTPENRDKLLHAQRRSDAIANAITFEEMTRAEADQGGLMPAKLAKVITPEGTVRYMSVRTDNDQITDMSGKPIEGQIVGGVGEEELKSYQQVTEETGEKANEYVERVNNLKDISRDIAEMDLLVEATDGAVLAERTGKGINWLVDTTQNILVALDIASGEEVGSIQQFFKDANDKEIGIRSENLPLINQMEASVDQRIRELLGSGAVDAAQAYSLFEAKKSLLAYKIGILMGQEGRALSEVEREHFKDLAGGGTTPEKFRQNMGSLLSTQFATLKDEAQALNDHNYLASRHEELYGTPGLFADVGDPEEMLLQDADDLVQRGYQILKDNSSIHYTSQTTPRADAINAEAQPQTSTVSPPPEAIQMLQEAVAQGDTAAIEEFDEVFGSGAASQILGR